MNPWQLLGRAQTLAEEQSSFCTGVTLSSRSKLIIGNS